VGGGKECLRPIGKKKKGIGIHKIMLGQGGGNHITGEEKEEAFTIGKGKRRRWRKAAHPVEKKLKTNAFFG